MDSLRIHLTTWNVANSEPIGTGPLTKMFDIDRSVDIYVISLQEVQSGMLDTLVSYVAYDDWTYHLIHMFAETNYYMIENVRLQGLSLSVFAQVSHLPYIKFIRTEYKRTGFKGCWGNKGGVAISCNIYGMRVCFLNSHLAPHLKSNATRIQHFESIVTGMDFEGTATILSHDVIFLAGDLNFRIDGLPVEFIKKCIAEKKLELLLEKDQLIPLYRSHRVFKEFVEEPITFQPTYKFDMGTSVYDTSPTKRLPAWTDRILYRINPDMMKLSDFAMKCCNLSPNPSIKSFSVLATQYDQSIKLIEGSYKCLMDYNFSDHKPVVAVFDMQIFKDDTPLIEIEVKHLWKTGAEWKVSIQFDPSYSSDGSDYLALYDKQFSDFRNFKSWVYAPARGPTLNKSPETETFIFPQCKIGTSGVFRLGYYSAKMSCLLALSNSFSITV